MSTFRFERAAVLRCVKHALASPSHTKGFGDTGPAKPALFLVKDDGIYVMSNGSPRDLDEKWAGPSDKSFVAYAKGYDPTKATDPGELWDKCRDAAGGDDFAESIELDAPLVRDLQGGGDLIISLTPKAMRVSVKLARDEAVSAEWLRKHLAGFVLYFPDGRGKTVKGLDLKKRTEPEARAVIARLPKAVILNDMPFDEALALYLRRTA